MLIHCTYNIVAMHCVLISKIGLRIVHIFCTTMCFFMLASMNVLLCDTCICTSSVCIKVTLPIGHYLLLTSLTHLLDKKHSYYTSVNCSVNRRIRPPVRSSVMHSVYHYQGRRLRHRGARNRIYTRDSCPVGQCLNALHFHSLIGGTL